MRSRELNKLEMVSAATSENEPVDRLVPARPSPVRSDRKVPAKPSAISGMPDALGLLKALRRCWLSAVLTGLCTAGAVVTLGWTVLPAPKYTAYALLQVASRPPQVAFTILETRSETRDETDKYQKTQLELIQSRAVLKAALRQPQIGALPAVREEEDALEWLDKDLQAEYSNDSDVLRLSLKGKYPQDIAAIVNAIVDVYLREIVTVEESKRRHRLEQLKEVYDQYEKSLSTKRQILRELAELAGSSDQKTLAYKQQLELEQRSMAEKELMQYRAEIRKARAELSVLQSRERTQAAEAPADWSREADEALSKDPQFLDGEKYVERLERQLQQMRRLARATQDPALRRIERDLTVARASLQQRRKDIEARVARDAELRGRSQARDEQLAAQERVAVLEDLERAAQQDVKRMSEQTRTSNQKSLDLRSRQDEIETESKAAMKIAEDMEALKVELRAEQRVKPLESADVPRKKEDKRPMMTVAMGFGTFAFVLLSFSWWEFRARRIDSAEDVVIGLGMQLVGALPALPNRVRRPIAGTQQTRDLYWHNLLLESIDATRTMILHASRDGSCRLLMITSALKGEGKTSLACHLARSLARAGRRTLLVDCDLRTPAAHRVFGEPVDPGFSELLRGEVLATDVIRPTPVKDLWILTAGQCDVRALQALALDGIGQVFAELKDRFDFVIVDSAPVLPVTDSLLIGQHVDAVLFSVLRDVSQLPKVYMAYERLSTLGMRMLGAVVAGARMEHHVYGGPALTEER